jgi:dissimilatory sulfite reductase (desulfoviridin) alpha/beta subunit
MQWRPEAEELLKKVPFFVRKKVRSRVEKEAKEAGKSMVTPVEVRATQKRYLTGMQAEVRGYQLDTCFGPQGCPNRANPGENLMDDIENLLREADLLSFLKDSVTGDLKFHHEFRVTLADCPNACSQPQIKDIGIIGAAVPEIVDAECTRCENCVEVCKDNAVALNEHQPKPQIDYKQCLNCGQCIKVCPSGTIQDICRGYRVQLGGKLGRHPQLAKELPGIYTEKEVLQIVQDCLTLYKQRSTGGRRFAEIFGEEEFQMLSQRYAGKSNYHGQMADR